MRLKSRAKKVKRTVSVKETGEVIIEGKFDSKKVWMTLLIVSLAFLILGALMSSWVSTTACLVFCCIAFITSVIGMIISMRDSNVKFEVTKQCIYRKTLLGRHTYLPLNSIRAVDMMWFNSISVRTAVGTFDCHMLSNRNEVFMEIKKLLDERQKTK